MQRELESAFRRTHYRVQASGAELVLRIDRAEPALAAMLRASAARSAALLTAFNPGGRRHAAFRNRQSQAGLLRELKRRGLLVLTGRNEDPRRLWPMERSVLVLDLALEDARQLAARHGQLAFLWVDASGTPRLIETAALPG